MTTDIVTVQLVRENDKEKWGFQISGGKDQDCPLVVSEITPGSIAERVGLRMRDMIVKINNQPAADITNKEAEASVDKGANNFALVIQRPHKGRKISFEKSLGDYCIRLDSFGKPQVIEECQAFISIVGAAANSQVKGKPSRTNRGRLPMPEIVEDPRYEGLDEADRAKVGTNDVAKPSLRRDWNCPWMKRDGKGLKRVVRSINDPTVAPAKTSHQHFYSEPHSILAPEAPPIPKEELERMIREKMGDKDAGDGKPAQSQIMPQQERQIIQQEMKQEPIQQEQQNGHAAMEVDDAAQTPNKAPTQKLQHNESLDDEEDFSGPPALETIEVQQQQLQQEREQNLTQQQEEQIVQQFAQQNVSEEHQQFNQAIVRELAIAIKESMQNYQDMGENYEPSADELIDVLKNLENLAAINPALYRAIVDQIKTPTANYESESNEQNQQQNGYEPQQNGYEEQAANVNGVHDQEVPIDDAAYEEVNGHVANGEDVVDRDLQNGMQNGLEVEPMQQEMTGPPKTEEELKKELIAQQVEQEHEEQMRQLKQRKKKQATPPPPPKTITVMAGSRSKAAWPIAPGSGSGVRPVQVELTSGSSEYQEEMEKNRREVAEAAGLKHVEVINGDEGFYPEPMKDYDYPWAGSLKPVSNKMGRREPPHRRGEDAGHTPWAGSLRHVNQKNRRQKKEDSDDDDLYGSAPWMGTLRHVTHENMVSKTIKPTPKFKKYPDEDAPNPFKGMQGRNAAPKYPLTPAAVFLPPEEGGAKEENVMEAEQVDRIRSNLRETRTVSSSLLKVLMPKLLKEHESKYEPLGHDESFNIMEEILAMQIGLNADQKVEDNDEAEQIIRAITHGEIDHSVYSQMADDLENAAQEKRKEKKVKKVKKGTGKKKTKKASESGTSVEPSASESTIPPAEIAV